jgi:hypothetical protein
MIPTNPRTTLIIPGKLLKPLAVTHMVVEPSDPLTGNLKIIRYVIFGRRIITHYGEH